MATNAFCKQLQSRLEATGDASSAMWHFMADILEHTANEATHWTHRADDARRIPDMIDDAVRWCREKACDEEYEEKCCPCCDGNGDVQLHDEGGNGMYWKCTACNGTGEVKHGPA